MSELHYFSEKPCKRGHISARFISNRRCVQCHLEYERNVRSLREPRERKVSTRALKPKLDGETSGQRWWRLNPGKNAIYEQNRRARLKANGGILSFDIVEKLMKAQNGLCVYCACDLTNVTPQIDHILPLALGGMNSDNNVQLLCRPCNSKKGCKHPDVFKKKGD